MNPWENESKSIESIKDFTQLCRHPTIRKTMFVGTCEYIQKEYEYLLQSPYFESDWKELLKVTGYGNPERYLYWNETTGNAIHMIHHLARFEEAVKIRLKNINSVYEFGGGFGNMAEIVSRYTGADITIQDLKPCLDMQKIYLENTCKTGKFIFTEDFIQKKYDLFISTWALSEVDLDVREKAESIIRSSKYVLIAYASMFDNVDNNGYFDGLTERITTHSWNTILIPTMDTNHKYLFGWNFYE